jgi:hypothetical protein
MKAGTIGLISLLAASPLRAQNLNADPNYMFAVVLGTGFYVVEDASFTVVRIPISVTLREITDENAGLQLLLPVTVGYASLDPEDLIDRWIPTELSTLSFIPGVEYRKPIGEHLLLKPFIQAGGGYDFKNRTTSGLIVGGARALWTYQPSEPWQIQIGSSLQWATEWRDSGGRRSNLGLFEFGADFRRDLPFCIGSRRLNGSLYHRWRYFFNDWNIASAPVDPIQVDHLFELGLSIGAEPGLSIFGMNFNRVSLGWVTGEDVNAITLGTGFPF